MGTVSLLLLFLAFTFGLAGLYSLASDLWLRDKRLDERMDGEFVRRQRERARQSPLFKDLGRLAAELEDSEERPGWKARLAILLEQAGLELAPRHFLALMVGAGLLSGALAGAFLKRAWVAPLVAPVGAALPLLYAIARRRGRADKMSAQLPDVFDAMARVLRAGHTLPQALQAAARDFRPPIAAELACCREQQNLGLPPEIAYQDLARRTGLSELRVFATAMAIQQQTGGNVAVLLDELGATGRARLRARLRLRALTAEGRLQATILVALPPVIFGVLWVVKPGYVRLMWQHPWLLVGTGASLLVGSLWVRAASRAEE